LGNYKPLYSPRFKEQLKQLSQRDVSKIEQQISDLLSDPWHNTEFLKGQYRGKRKIWLNRLDRLVFVICEECRESGHRSFNQCADCDSVPDNTVVIGFIIFGHNY